MVIGREKSIFLSALDLESEARRRNYLDEACGDDSSLRRAVDELLDAHRRPDNVLDEGPDDGGEPDTRLRRQLEDAAAALGLDTTSRFFSSAGASPSIVAADRAGEEIGPYVLLEKLGEGGFGQVYVARQDRPVRRRVALKLLKPGMDSREVIARFEAERQALAMMDHPNIARVFDAGATEAGQPYFVMELVHGVPITDACRRDRLSLRQRLELFVDMCQAVQHAHQKGVIHRDLKPSNVLITSRDDARIVKVIDFGVAKAIGEPLTESAVHTRVAQMIGTPMYMSPEQAEMNSPDVDTRSDIYSLGVILYELLTGTTPFDRERLRGVGFDELRRIIRDEEPPRPSTRLTTLSRGAVEEPTAAETGESRLPPAVLRGDLDWVVMKALEKDRRRRYDTAADLGQDVRRYLRGLPVVARPPSRLYRFHKFVRRNVVALAAAMLVLLALMSATVISSWQALRANEARAEAERLRQEAVDFADRLKETNVLLDSARANADEERWSLAAAQYTKATRLLPDHYLTWSGRGGLYVRLGAWRAAGSDFAKALKLGAPANNPSWWGVPPVCLYAGEEDAYRLARQQLDRQLKQAEEPFFVTFAVRGILIRPASEQTARELAVRMEQSLREQPLPDSSADGRPRGGRGRPPRLPGPPRGPPRGGPFGPPRPPPQLLWYAAGLARFRAGEHERSIEHLRRMIEFDRGFPAYRIAHPVLAMAYHESGRNTDAERSLEEAERLLDEWITSLEQNGSVSAQPLPWFDFIECLILYREAHQRVRGEPAKHDGRLREIEEGVLASLSVDG